MAAVCSSLDSRDSSISNDINTATKRQCSSSRYINRIYSNCSDRKLSDTSTITAAAVIAAAAAAVATRAQATIVVVVAAAYITVASAAVAAAASSSSMQRYIYMYICTHI